MNYEKHDEVIKILERDREAQEDTRESIAEETAFITHPNGQWEPFMWDAYDGRPRYQFDMVKPAIGRAWAEMAANDYSATTQPVGGGADEKVSNVIDGLIRTIYNISSFADISARKGKKMIGVGMGSWRIISTYIGESFDQDLKIIPIQNEDERVFYDSESELQTHEDADHVFVLASMHKDAAKNKFGRDVKSIGETRESNSYENKKTDQVLVCEILYKKPIKKTIYKLEDGKVVDSPPDGFSADETNSRDITSHRVYSRKFDNYGWLGAEKETVFDLLPVITCYSHFDIVENKVIFHGMIRDLMDEQRVFNYVESRKTEEAVLGRPDVLMLTAKQAKGRESDFGNINRDPRRAHLYEVDGNAKTSPYVIPGSMPSPALTEISADMIRNMQLTTGMPNSITDAEASRGDSDFRANQRSSLGQLGTFEYYRGWQMALEHSAKVILGAIPRVYDSERAIRITDEAGQSSEVRINERQSGGDMLNDLTVGKYDICVKIGESFETRQAKANDGIRDLAQYDPTIIQRNTDILASNIDAPGMGSVADRERNYLMAQGVIPEDQWTEDEKEKAAAASQQPKEQTFEDKIAQAELQKAENQAMAEQYKALGRQAELEHKERKQQIDTVISQHSIEMDKLKQKILEQSSDYENLLKLVQSVEISQRTQQTVDKSLLPNAEAEIQEDETKDYE